MKPLIVILLSLLFVQPVVEPEVIPPNPCEICPSASPNFTLTLKQGNTVINPSNAVVGQTYTLTVDMSSAVPCSTCGAATNPAYQTIGATGVTMAAERDASCGDTIFYSVTINSPTWVISIAPWYRPFGPTGGYAACFDYMQEIGTLLGDPMGPGGF